MVRKPAASVISAVVPGMARRRKVSSEASWLFLPVASSDTQLLVYCTPCETDTDRMRNGTRIAKGSSPKPVSVSRPNSQITATNEHTNGSHDSLKLPR